MGHWDKFYSTRERRFSLSPLEERPNGTLSQSGGPTAVAEQEGRFL